MSSVRKFIFRYFDAKILIFIRDRMWKKKKKVDGGEIRLNRGEGVLGMFLKKGGRTGFSM